MNIHGGAKTELAPQIAAVAQIAPQMAGEPFLGPVARSGDGEGVLRANPLIARLPPEVDAEGRRGNFRRVARRF